MEVRAYGAAQNTDENGVSQRPGGEGGGLDGITLLLEEEEGWTAVQSITHLLEQAVSTVTTGYPALKEMR